MKKLRLTTLNVHQSSGPGDQGSILGRVTPETQKWYLITPCLTLRIIRYESKVSGVIQGKNLRPLLQLGVVAIEKEAFGSPKTAVGRLTTLLERKIRGDLIKTFKILFVIFN